MGDPIPAKKALRREMRALRKALPDQEERSERIWAYVRSIDAVRSAAIVMVFTSVPGEPDTAPFIDWCRAQGKQVALPEDAPPPAPDQVDVVIVPGTAFTAAGDRLGQGGGWYDRFLAGVRPDCRAIGVCFEPQLLESLPTEPHDRTIDIVVTDRSRFGAD